MTLIYVIEGRHLFCTTKFLATNMGYGRESHSNAYFNGHVMCVEPILRVLAVV